jgi:hypothetical protein
MKLDFIFFAIIPFVLMAIICVGMPFWKNQLMKEAGEKTMALAKKKSKLQLIAIPTAYVLLILSILVDFGRMNFVIPYCAVLGLFIAIKESTLLPVNGVYEKLIINGSEIIRFAEITSVSEPDSTTADNVVKITTKHGPRQLIFDNSNEALEVRKLLKAKSA